ncbi:MAG: hypothetical protein AAF975_05510 [Spirochaetota bacterium]
MSNLLGPRLLQQDLQTQLNTCLVRLEYDINQRLGQHTLQKLQGHGWDLLRGGRESLLNLVKQVHQAFALGEGPLHLEFRWRSGSHHNAERFGLVEDGYLYLYLSERNILRYFLQRKTCYKVLLELLADHIVRYMEKVYYRLEQQWQEFQGHYMVADHDAQATAAQIAQHHKRMQQLQSMARSFWQDNFTEALKQLCLDLPEWDDLPHVSERPAAAASFEPYYIALLQELESRCSLMQQREGLQLRLRKILEQSLDGFPLELKMDPESGTQSSTVLYTEYSGKGFYPDELAELRFRYATGTWLQQWEVECEERLIILSREIQNFFAQVEKASRFQWLRQWFYGGVQQLLRRLIFRLSRKQNGNHLEKFSPDSSHAAKLLPVDTGSFTKDTEMAENPEINTVNNVLKELGENSSEWCLGSNSSFVHEIRLLSESLQRAGLALSSPKSYRYYKLREQLQVLREELFSLYYQAPYGNDVGIQITASYRTVSKRRETFRRIEKILQEFCSNCQLLDP